MSKLDPHWQEHADNVAACVVARLRDEPHLLSPWLNPKQAAAYLGLDERGLETMRREERGPDFSRVGRRIVRYHVADLDAWLRRHAEQRGGAE